MNLNLKSHLFYIITLTLSLVGCIGGLSTTENNQGTTTKLANEVSNIRDYSNQPMLEVDPLQIDNPFLIAEKLLRDQINTCTPDNSICFATTQPSATYVLDNLGTRSWALRDVSDFIKITFNTNVDSKFRISNIYNSLPSSLDVAGRIIQIDTSSCDSLIQSGATAGKQCYIYYFYQGTALDSTTVNQIHFVFSWGADQQYDFNFSASNQVRDNLNTPVITASGDDLVPIVISSSENSSNTGLNYSNVSSIELKNVGTGMLNGNNESPTIIPTVVGRYGSNANLYYIDANATDLGTGSLAPGDVTMLNFRIAPNSSASIGNQMGRFSFYYSLTVPGVNETHSTIRFAISQGDIRTNNYAIGYSPLINLTRNNVYSESHVSYAIPLKNFQLYARYNAMFNISSKVANGILNYTYGDYNLGLSASDLTSKVQFFYDPDCFTSGFDPRYSNDLDSRSCPVEIQIDPQYLGAKPWEFELYASYDSPTQDSHVEQFLGTVSLNFLPPGNTQGYDYQPRCKNTSFDGTFLNALCLDDSLNYVATSLDYSGCTPGSTVSDFHGKLTCDLVNQPLPPGNQSGYDYQTHCKGIVFDGKNLIAACYNDHYALNPSNLDYTTCAQGSTVSDLHGVLTCDSPKNNISCNVIYHQSRGDYSFSGDKTLNPGDCIQVDASDGTHKYELDMEQSGNFAWYKCSINDSYCIADPNRQSIVSSTTDGVNGRDRGARTTMQQDGNLVVYDNNNTPISWTGTNGYNNATLRLQADGNLVIYKAGHDGQAGYAKWQAGDGFGHPY